MKLDYLHKLRTFHRNVHLYFISWAIVGFNHFGIIAVLFNLYLLRLGYGPAFIGMVNGAGFLTYAALCFPLGLLGTRWSTRGQMIIGMSMITLGLGLLILNEELPRSWRTAWIISSYMLTWAGASLYYVCSLPFLTASTSADERSHAFAIRAALQNLSAFTGSLIGGLLPGLISSVIHQPLDQPAPYRYSLWIACFLYGGATMTVAATRDVTPENAQVEHTNPTISRQDKALAPVGLILSLALVSFLTGTAGQATSSYFNVYMDSALAAPTFLIGILAAANRMLCILLSLLSPVVIARFGKVKTIMIGYLLVSVSLLPLGLIPHWAGAGLGFICTVATNVITLTVFIMFHQESVAPRWRVVMSGAVNTASGLSGALVAYGGAVLITAWGYRPLFLVTAGLVILGVLLFRMTVNNLQLTRIVPHKASSAD